MRVALVFPGCHRRAGVERSMWEAARAWRDRVDVTVVSADVDRDGLDGVDVRITGVPGQGPAAFSRAARAELAGGGFDDVVSFGAQDVPATILWVNSVHRAWLEASRRFPGTRGLERFPALRYALPAHRERLRLERHYFINTSARTVVCVADQVGRDLTRLYRVPAEKLLTIHNGFDPAEFNPSHSDDRARIRRELGIADDRVLACIAANELPRKGFDVLLRAVAETGDPRLDVLLVGRAAPDAYRDLITELGLAGRVHYAGLRRDVGAIHAASDLFVLPTKYEAFCLAIVEALASGLPVITSDVPGAGDLIADRSNGRLLDDPNDHQELARLLREALDDGTRKGWAANARPSVDALAWPQVLGRAADALFGRA